MLDRLQALNLIAWQRFPSVIEVTVASDASQVLVHGVGGTRSSADKIPFNRRRVARGALA